MITKLLFDFIMISNESKKKNEMIIIEMDSSFRALELIYLKFLELRVINVKINF